MISSDINQSITIEINTSKASGPEDFLNTIANMLWYIVPFVLLVAGTFGNVMTVVVMRGLRASQSTACLSVYFTALAVSDQCLLTSILWFWIDVVFTWPPSYYRFNLLCTVLYFVCYTSTQTSAWFLVAMTYQRVTSVVAPHRVGVLCTVRRGKIITATIGIVACGLNLHFLFTIVYSREYGGCASGEKYAPFIDVFTMVDLFIASVIPFLLLLFGNSVLIIQVVRSMKLSWRLRGKVLVNDVTREGKGAAPSEESASILGVGRSNLDIDVPHGGRMNCLVSLLRLSRLKQGPHWDLWDERTNPPRQSLERLCFSQRGGSIRKRCTFSRIGTIGV
ncbi:hypothetical protein ACOMHN_024203 [Nucella lapillus]